MESKKNLTRRDFLKLTTVVSTGALVAACAPAAPAPAAPAAPAAKAEPTKAGGRGRADRSARCEGAHQCSAVGGLGQHEQIVPGRSLVQDA